MTRQLLYVIGAEARNRLRRQAARVRSPRYALALLVGLGYFFLVFGGRRAFNGGGNPAGQELFRMVRQLGPLVLAAYAAVTWIFGRADALAFRPAEVSFLFTAPLTRRDLLRYKLLQAQVPLLFSATFMTLISHGTLLPWYLRLPSFWLLLSILQLHHMAAALVHASAAQEGIVGWRRNWLPIAIFGTAAVILLAALQPALAVGAAGIVPALHAAMAEPLPRLVLAPFRFALAPLLAAPRAWLPAAATGLLVLLLHYAWVLRSNHAFEEAAAEAGERRARATKALRTGGGWRAYSRALRPAGGKASSVPAPPWRLALAGAPAGAILWKNLTFARRNTSLASPLLIVIAVSVFITISSTGGGSPLDALRQVGFMALAFAGFLVVFGPVMVRNDLRMDLRQVELLRTLPLPAHQLVSAEIAASAITLTLIQFSLLAGGLVLLGLGGSLALPPLELALAVGGALLLVPALATLGVTIQCAIALTFPAWVHLGRERPAGVEAMGQNILTMAGSLLLLALLLVLPALVTFLAAVLLSVRWGEQAAWLGILPGIAAVYGEVWLAARALGRLFERTDPTAIGLAR